MKDIRKEGNRLIHGLFNNGGGGNGFGGSSLIGYNQSARTQFDASRNNALR